MKAKMIKQLMFFESEPDKGFNFGYFLSIRTLNNNKLKFIVECNNAGSNNNIQETERKTRRKIENAQDVSICLQNYLSDSVVLVPAFLRPGTEKRDINTYSLTSMALKTDREDIKRIDRQLLCMINDAKEFLKKQGYSYDEQIILTGYSASAKFAQRFAFLYPEEVQMVIAGGMSATLCLPVSEYKGCKLNYPLGTNDYEKIVGKKFDEKQFSRIKQYFFLGSLDTNDPVPFPDNYTDDERNVINKIFGKDMQNDRWPKMLQILEELKLGNITCIKIDGEGHEIKGMMGWLFDNVFK